MNRVNAIGRLTRDVELKSTRNGSSWIRFSLACDRGKDRDGNDKGADFLPCKALGRTAELISTYVKKGDQLGIEGKIETGSYQDQTGNTHYTTDVFVDRIDFIGSKGSRGGQGNNDGTAYGDQRYRDDEIDDDFHLVAEDDDVPF